MEPERDQELTELLKSWRVPDAPRSLDGRVLAISVRGWRFWLTGSVRVPVPALVAMLLLLAALTVVFVRRPVQQQTPAAPQFNLTDFQTVETVKVEIMRAEDAR